MEDRAVPACGECGAPAWLMTRHSKNSQGVGGCYTGEEHFTVLTVQKHQKENDKGHQASYLLPLLLKNRPIRGFIHQGTQPSKYAEAIHGT
jgi:hypothetical protein